MIKDRKVVDERGEFSVFSPTALTRRKHHKGAAAIALTLEIFKKRILSVHAAGETARLERWVNALDLESVESLLAAAGRPTFIVPGNITFFPLRVEENLLKRGAELFFRGLRDQAREELLIEGNILLRDTDMDIRFGPPVSPDIAWHFWERRLVDWSFRQVDSLEHLFDLSTSPEKWVHRVATSFVGQNTNRLRDHCMKQIYRLVTVNLSHLASELMIQLVDRGVSQIDEEAFRRALYLAIKYVQQDPEIHLHPSLVDPERYEPLHEGRCTELEQLISLASRIGLMRVEDGRYHFLEGMSARHDFHKVRLHNTVQVYANEIAVLPKVRDAVTKGLEQGTSLDGTAFARLLFDDELRSFERARTLYAEPRHQAINIQETATRNGEPYLFLPTERRKLGIVLVHGLLASPAELRSFGKALQWRGYPVIGVRLKGHGTSPWDLRERAWQEWLASVRRGYEILNPFVDAICIVGFSMGGVLALRLAAESPPGLAGVASVSAPIKLRNKNLVFVPVMHTANKLARWTAALEGVMPFRTNQSEHPDINYRHIPVRALYELRRSIDDLTRHLRHVVCPVAVFQGTGDQVVAPKSAKIIYERIAADEKWLHWIESDRHGVLNEDVDGCQDKVLQFIASLESASEANAPADWIAPTAKALDELASGKTASVRV
jgi:esterase/lipase